MRVLNIEVQTFNWGFRWFASPISNQEEIGSIIKTPRVYKNIFIKQLQD